ncbi:MAG: transglycosylase domain-containing protein [Egibacteraceae bacterium]
MSAPNDLRAAVRKGRHAQNPGGRASGPSGPLTMLARRVRAAARRVSARVRVARVRLDEAFSRSVWRPRGRILARIRGQALLLQTRARLLERTLRAWRQSTLRRLRRALDAQVIAVSHRAKRTRRRARSATRSVEAAPPAAGWGHAQMFKAAGSPPARTRSLLARHAATLLASGVAGTLVLLLLVGFCLPAATANAARSLALGIAPAEQAALSNLSQRSVVLAGDGTVLAVLHAEIDRKVVPLHTIPQWVRQAVVTAEDRKFWEHSGYDIEGIGRAMVVNFQTGEIAQGGSTITQQIAKSVVGNERTLERKLTEFAYALALEREYTKEELLERYLNQVYFGSGAYGIAAAAEQYFDQTDPSQLRVEQGALLAGLIRSPGTLDPRRNPEQALARRNEVLQEMGMLGYLDPGTVDLFVQTPLGVVPPREDAPLDPYLTAAVQQEFLANPIFGPDREARADLLFSGGLKVETSLDPRLQQTAREVVNDALPSQRGPTAAIAAVDPRDGRILAIYGGTDFEQEQFNLATQGRRQPGSSFKPFVLATALQQGIPLRLSLDGNSPLRIRGSGSPEWGQKGVTNFGGSDYGRIDLRGALVNSVNTAFAQLMMIVGPREVLTVAGGMGIDVATATAGIENPSIALGGLERGVTPLEMASAYGTFANGGRHVAASLINRVTGPDGTVLYDRRPQPQQVLDPRVNAAMVSVMQDVVRAGTGARARLENWEAAGKTGTTQRNADAWFVGYLPVMSTAVWMGYPEGQIAMRGDSSSSFSAGIWRAFMTRALEGVPPVGFPNVEFGEGLAAGQGIVTVPDLVGQDETDALRTLAQAKLVGDLRLVPSRSPAGTVISQRPRPGSTAQVGDSVVISVSTGQPPPPPPPPTPEAGQQAGDGPQITIPGFPGLDIEIGGSDDESDRERGDRDRDRERRRDRDRDRDDDDR